MGHVRLLITILSLFHSSVVVAAVAQNVVVFPLHTTQLKQRELSLLEDLLRQQVDKVPKRAVVDQKRVQKTLEKLGTDPKQCRLNTACLVQVAQACGAKKLLYGSVSRDRAQLTVELAVVDVPGARVRDQLTGHLKGSAESIQQAVRGLVVQLVAPRLYLGNLDVRMATAGASVTVDGESLGGTPMVPIASLQPGDHQLEIRLAQCQTLTQEITVMVANTTVVEVGVVGRKLVPTISHEPMAWSRRAGASPGEPAQQVALLLQPHEPEVVTAPPDRSEPISMLQVAGTGSVATGVVVALAGGVALGLWGYAHTQINAAMDGPNVVDARQYDSWDKQRAAYEAIGMLGGVGVVVGSAALAAGVTMLVWEPAQ